jgi:hypothetical protein
MRLCGFVLVRWYFKMAIHEYSFLKQESWDQLVLVENVSDGKVSGDLLTFIPRSWENLDD